MGRCCDLIGKSLIKFGGFRLVIALFILMDSLSVLRGYWSGNDALWGGNGIREKDPYSGQ